MIFTLRPPARLFFAAVFVFLIACQHKPGRAGPEAPLEAQDNAITESEEAEAIKEPEVTLNVPAFRSVLDGKPRMLTVPLGDSLCLAYDTTSASLYKAWPGKVALAGPVYDETHGNQPTSVGPAYYLAENANWQLRTKESAEPAEVRFVGHKVAGDRVTLLYQYQSEEGWTAQIEETPQKQPRESGVILIREFLVDGLPADTTLSLTSVVFPKKYTVSGDAAFTRESKRKQTRDTNMAWEGRLDLNNGLSEIKLVYSPPPEELEEEETLAEHPGLTLINSSDCAACHNQTLKTVGPSYLDIAQRYQNTEGTINRLADKIIDGGTGVWGEANMTPHPTLDRKQAESMVRYILALNDIETPGRDNTWTLGLDSVPVILDSTTPEIVAETPGALFYLHYFSGDQPNIDQLRANPPAMAALAPQVHIRDVDGLMVEKEHFAYRVKTHLRLTEPATKTLRLVSDDGAYLYLNGNQVIDNWGFHGPDPMDATLDLEAGDHPLEIIYFQGTAGAALSLQWFNEDTGAFELVPASALVVKPEDYRKSEIVIRDEKVIKSIPGDTRPLQAVHPAFDLYQARPPEFEPRAGGIDFFDDGRMVVASWDPEGTIYIVENYTDHNPQNIRITPIAKGLAEPLGIKVVGDEIYVMQKQELTRLVDDDGDGIIDRYMVVANDWSVTDNFHEFSFGLEYRDGYFYATLATAILPGGASASPQAPDRGTAMRIHRETGEVQFLAHGLRTPNGIGAGVDNQLFISDNQGDWLPANKIVELTPGAWYGSRSVNFEATKYLIETKPVVWLPQDEIGNSPSEPGPLNIGPYQNQMVHGDVTHGGLKRVYAERVNGRLQGVVFRFSQGFEAGINRLDWAPDGSLIVGGVGNPGNWSQPDKLWHGLQRLVYNNHSAFEMLSVSARSNGFEIEFTEPLAAGENISAEDFLIQQWYYEPTAEYGGPKKGLEELVITRFSISDDRTKVAFVLPGLKENHVVYFRIVRPFQSQFYHELWTTEAWYTLNAIPTDNPVMTNNYRRHDNELSPRETAQGWKLLFDGKTTRGLRNYNAARLGNLWEVDKGTLHLARGTGNTGTGGDGGGGGDIVITDKPYENYELYLEWKLRENGNSGIIYNVKEDKAYEHAWQTGPEYQLLDNIGHPDGQIDKHRAGDLYDLIESKFVSVNSVGEWNRSRLIVINGKVEHWLNGYKVVETQMWTPRWQTMVAESKFKDMPEFGTVRRGHVVLQDHGDEVWFRNIKIREL